MTYQKVKEMRDDVLGWLEAATAAVAGAVGVKKLILNRLISRCQTVRNDSDVILEDLDNGVSPDTVIKDAADTPAVAEMLTSYGEAAAEAELAGLA